MKNTSETLAYQYEHELDTSVDVIPIDYDISNNDLIEDLDDPQNEDSNNFSITRLGDPVYFMEATKFWQNGFGSQGPQGWKSKSNWVDYAPGALSYMTGRVGRLAPNMEGLGRKFKIGREAYDKFGGKGYSKPGFIIFGPYPKFSPSHGLRTLPNLANFPHRVKFRYFIDAIGIPDNEPILRLQCTNKKGKGLIAERIITPKVVRESYTKKGKPARLVAKLTSAFQFNNNRKTFSQFETRIWWSGKGRVIFGGIELYQWG